MSPSLFFENKKYISAKEASSKTGYSRDYIGQLARSNKIDSKIIGRSWYVREDAILNYKKFLNQSKLVVLLEPLPNEIQLPEIKKIKPPEVTKAPDKVPAKNFSSRARNSILFISIFLLFAGIFSWSDNNFSTALKNISSNFLSAALIKSTASPIAGYDSLATAFKNYLSPTSSTNLSDLATSYKNYITPAPTKIIGVSSINISDLISAYKNYLTPPAPAEVLGKIKISDLAAAYRNYIVQPPASPLSGGSVSPAPAIVAAPKTITKIVTVRGPAGPQGLTGPQGSAGPQGPAGENADTALFVSRSFFDGQVNRIFDSISNSTSGLSSALSKEVDTKLLTVSGNATVGGDFTSNGQGIFTRVPTLAHAFTPAWPLGTSNVADSSLYINPASSVLNGNLIGAAVNGEVKFLVNAEGDIYGNNLILTGSTTTGATTVASLLVLGTFSQTGASTFSTGTGAVSLNGDTTIATGKNLTLTAGNITLSSGTINKLTITPSATGATLTIADGKILTVNNSLTFAGTDTTTMTFPSTSATIARTDAGNTFTGHQTIEGVTSTGATGTGKFVFDTSPVFTTPALGTPSALVLTNATGLPAASVLAGTFGTGAYMMDTSLVVPTIYGSSTTGNNLTLRSNSADLTSGSVLFTDTTDSSSTTTGAVQITGGLGVAKNIYALNGYLSTPTNTTTSIVTIDGTQDLTNKTYNGLTITANGTNTLNIATGQTLTVTTGGTIASGSAAYTPATDYATSAQGTLATNAIPKGTGTATGDLITFSAASTPTNIADVAVGRVLVSGGVGVVPAWSTNALTIGTSASVSGSNTGDDATNSQYSGLITSQTAKYFYAAPNAGDGTPSFRAILASDIPALSYAAPLSGTINEIAYFNSATTIGSLAVATYPSLTELSYVKGVTSAIQTQLGNKQPLVTNLTSIGGLANATGWLHNDGAGAFAYSTPTATNVGLGNVTNDAQIKASLGTNVGDLITFSAASTPTNIAAVATGQYLASQGINTQPAWATLNQAAVAGLTTASTPTFAGLALGTGSITMSGSLADTTNRVTKGWFTNLEITNLPTVNGGTLATALGNYGGFLTSAGATPGTYNNVTVATSGLVTSGSNVAYLTSLSGALLANGTVGLSADWNAGAHTITATTFSGALSGNASTATNVAVGGITGLGTNVATALAIAVGTSGSPLVNGGVLGTPSSGTGTNITGIPAANILAGTFGTGNYSFGTGTLTVGAITSSGALALGSNTITSGLINGQTINATANFTGTLTVAGVTTLSNLTASSAIYTDSSKNLTSAVPTSGQLGYWTRSGTNLYNTNQGDNVGIGTTAPVSQLANTASASTDWAGVGVAPKGISWTAATASKYAAVINNSTANGYGVNIYANSSGTEKLLSLSNASADVVNFLANGNVGIGTTAPGTYKLNIAGTGYLGAAAWVYSSDQRLKENISYLQNNGTTGSLDKIMQLKPARFDYIVGEKNNIGFIAQDVQSVIPEAVVVTNPITGMLGLKTDFIIPYVVGAIQELNLNLDAISGVVTPVPTAESTSFATAFFNNLKTTIGTWLADAGNGIGDFFANRVRTKELCVAKADGTEFCANGDQLAAMAANVSSSPSGGGVPAGSGGGGSGGSGGAATATCSDGIKNQDETGIDTGGVCAPAPSDISALTTAKATVEGLITGNAVESTTPGDHIVGALATLTTANTATNATTADTQSVVDGQVTTLNSAIATYNAAIVPTPATP